MLVRDVILDGLPSIQTCANLAAVFEADCCFRTGSRLNPAADGCFKCEPLSSCTMVLDDLDSLVPSEAQGVLREKLRSYVGTYVSRQRVRMLNDMISFQLGLEMQGQFQEGPRQNLPTQACAYVRTGDEGATIYTYVRTNLWGAPNS